MSTTNRYLRLTSLGQRAFSKGRLERALSLFSSAEEEAQRIADRELQDRAFCNRCVVLVELDRLDGAVGELKHVLMRSRDPFTSWMAAYYTAQAYEVEENLSRALAYARRASEFAAMCGTPQTIGASANQHGVLALRQSAFAEASERFREALRLAGEIEGDPTYAAITRDNLGYCLMCTGRAVEGLDLCRDALATLESLGARHLLAEVVQDLCYGSLQVSDLGSARSFGERALDLAREYANETVERNTLMLLADACLDADDPSGADRYLDQLAAYYPDFRGMKTFLHAFNVREVINLKA